MLDTQYVENLRLRYNSGEGVKFVFFWGHQPSKSGVTASCFSQWYSAPFTVEGNLYPTAEHFMMAEKAALFGDQATRAQVLQASNPGAAKALGRQVSGFDESTWLEERFSLVVRANAAKFAQNPELGQYLKQQGRVYSWRRVRWTEFGESAWHARMRESTTQIFGVASISWALRSCRCAMTPNPSIERTSQRPLRALCAAAHVER